MIDAYGLHIGPLYIHFYALILVMAIFVGTWFTARRAKSKGEKPEMVWDIITWALLPGIIGARLYHVLTPTPASGLTTQYYFQHPLEILAIWNGGLGIYGAVLGGAVGIILYAKYHHISILKWLDLAMPGLLLGQAIGRWGILSTTNYMALLRNFRGRLISHQKSDCRVTNNTAPFTPYSSMNHSGIWLHLVSSCG